MQELYPLYVENELSPKLKKQIDEHLASCEACQLIYKKEHLDGEVVLVPGEIKKVDVQLSNPIPTQNEKAQIVWEAIKNHCAPMEGEKILDLGARAKSDGSWEGMAAWGINFDEFHKTFYAVDEMRKVTFPQGCGKSNHEHD